MKIITDTGSDILEIEAKAMGVDLVPISANFEDVIFDRNTEENFKAFYEKLRSEEMCIRDRYKVREKYNLTL